jgi:hypothetical protein
MGYIIIIIIIIIIMKLHVVVWSTFYEFEI